jgi:polysaccharide biosynthesis/export protein
MRSENFSAFFLRRSVAFRREAGNLEGMEVIRSRSLVVCCALIGFSGRLNAQSVAVNNAAGATNVAGTNAVNVTRAIVRGSTFDLDNQHKIRPGDKLSFRVAEDREDAKPLVVTDSGEIELPSPFGRFAAAGKTCKVLAQEIKLALEKDYYKRATVHLGIDAMNNVRGKAYVSGQVSKPGPVNIPVDAPLKLSQAILLAGPPTQWAKLSAVKVVRQTGRDTQTMVIDVGAILNGGRLEKDMVLEPDDLVIVPERGYLIGGGN